MIMDIVMPAGHDDSSREVRLREESPRWSLDQLVASWLGGFTDSERTRDAYRDDLRAFLTWCTERGLDPLTLGLPEAQMYGAYLAETPSASTGKPLSARTRARRLNAVSSFYGYLVRAGERDANPLREMPRPKYDRKHSPTRAFTAEQAKEMFRLAPTHKQRTIDGRCAALVMHLLVDTGGRVSELCNANLDDLGYRDGMRVLTLYTKGSKVRDVPIPAQLAPLLDAWRIARPDTDDPALLVDQTGRRLTRFQVHDLIKKLAKHAGVPEAHRITPHSARHSFNRIAAESGLSLADRQRALGHSSPAITQLYDDQQQDLGGHAAHTVAARTFVPLDTENDHQPQDKGDQS